MTGDGVYLGHGEWDLEPLELTVTDTMALDDAQIVAVIQAADNLRDCAGARGAEEEQERPGAAIRTAHYYYIRLPSRRLPD